MLKSSHTTKNGDFQLPILLFFGDVSVSPILCWKNFPLGRFIPRLGQGLHMRAKAQKTQIHHQFTLAAAAAPGSDRP